MNINTIQISSMIKLAFIASNGRSGSTLLDLILGAHPHCWTMGEVQRLSIDWRENLPCGCGENLTSCEFWSPYFEKFTWLKQDSDFDRFRNAQEGKPQGKVIRLAELLHLLRRQKGVSDMTQSMEAYSEHNVMLFKELLQQVQLDEKPKTEWLIDASKDPYRLMYLSNAPSLQLAVFHVVKHPCAFVYSMGRRYDGLKRYSVYLRMIFRWILENAIIRLVCHRYNHHHLLIPYECLAANTQAMCKRICQHLDIPFSQEMVSNFRAKQHAISGNDMRFKSDQIKLDEKWKQHLPTLLKWMVLGVTYFLGYRWYQNQYRQTQVQLGELMDDLATTTDDAPSPA